MKIRDIEEKDRDDYLRLVIELSKFNRAHHPLECKNDDYEMVLSAIKENAEKRLDHKSDGVKILVVEGEIGLIGYAVGEIYEENATSDNGTGKMGLFDELYLDDRARGLGLGQMLLDQIMAWFKSHDINRVKLHAYSWNEHAKKMYAHNGFNEYAVSYERFL